MITVEIRWQKILKISEFDNDENLNYLSKNSGLYLWIVGWHECQPRRILYVGETNSDFAGRQSEHFKNILGGSYLTVNLKPNTDLADVFINHWHDKTTDDFEAEGIFSFPLIHKLGKGAFLKAFINKSEIENRLELLNKMSIAFGTVEKLPSDIKNYKQVEAALILGMRKYYHARNNNQPLRMKLKKGQRFRRDIPIGAISAYPTVDFDISHLQDSSVVRLIPQELLDIKEYRQ